MNAATAVLPLLGAPLIGAVVLAALGRHAGRGVREVLTLATLGLTLAGLILGLVDWAVLGRGIQVLIDLGPLDPGQPLGGLAWSLAPVAIAVLFVAIAVPTRSRLLSVLAASQLAVAVIAAASEVVARPDGSEPAGGSGLLVDPLAVTLLTISVVVGGLITIYALGYEPEHLARRRLPVGRTAAFVAWLLLFVAAMNLLVLADDLRLLVVGWEVTTLCSFALIGFDGDATARAAARQALAYNLLGGVALGGATVLAGPGSSLSGLVSQAGAGGAALPFVLTGCILAAATKSALVPFHPWLLGAMVAAAPVSALLHASAMVKAGSYLLLRLAPPIAEDGLLGPVLTLVGGLTFAVTAFAALRERDLKRILALSTISTLGLIAAAAGLGTPAALAAGVLLLAFHAIAKALAFLSVGTIEQAGRTRDLEALVGSLRAAPRLAGPLVIAAAAMALPPFGLVVAKWALLELAARDILLIVLMALGGAAYMVVWTKVVARLLVRRQPPPFRPADVRRLSAWQRVPVDLLGLASAIGLVVAAPVARALADPAGLVAFGTDPGLATGWSIALDDGAFSVPAVALLGGVAMVATIVVGRRIRTTAPAPYLSGADMGDVAMGGATPTTFHGGLGRPIEARSGGFYWGGGSRGPTSTAAPPGGLATTSATVAGWLLITLLALAAVLSALARGGAS